MLKSMTAYGRKEISGEWGTLTWEIRSVNHRYLDISLRMPEELRTIEPDVRELLAERLKRGKLEVGLRLRSKDDAPGELQIHTDLARQVITACQELIDNDMRSHAPLDPMDVLRWPGVVGQPEPDYKPVQQAALSLLDEALNDFIASREREGEKIAGMLTRRCDEISTIVGKVRERRPQVLEKLREKWLARIAEIDVQVDPQRLEQEVVFAANKLDVDEELDRLEAHVSELHNVLKRKEPVGRRLDFLIQEFNREANTLGSKSADAQTTALSVDLKVLIEQMREQVQNVE
ncbi:YicC/YloC family endoribonuclease [Granulosicoccaceae sp. 1_MG-2023]|nr:YicC/YloC family endoribonuclease [Granulosicoccaceae sp. 1_MG-2023]